MHSPLGFCGYPLYLECVHAIFKLCLQFGKDLGLDICGLCCRCHPVQVSKYRLYIYQGGVGRGEVGQAVGSEYGMGIY